MNSTKTCIKGCLEESDANQPVKKRRLRPRTKNGTPAGTPGDQDQVRAQSVEIVDHTEKEQSERVLRTDVKRNSAKHPKERDGNKRKKAGQQIDTSLSKTEEPKSTKQEQPRKLGVETSHLRDNADETTLSQVEIDKPDVHPGKSDLSHSPRPKRTKLSENVDGGKRDSKQSEHKGEDASNKSRYATTADDVVKKEPTNTNETEKQNNESQSSTRSKKRKGISETGNISKQQSDDTKKRKSKRNSEEDTEASQEHSDKSNSVEDLVGAAVAEKGRSVADSGIEKAIESATDVNMDNPVKAKEMNGVEGAFSAVVKKEIIDEEMSEPETRRPRRALRARTKKLNYKEIDSDEEKRLEARLELKRKAQEQQQDSRAEDDEEDYIVSSESSDDSESSHEEPRANRRGRTANNISIKNGTSVKTFNQPVDPNKSKQEVNSAKQFEGATRKNRQKYESQVKAGEILSKEEKEKRRLAYDALDADGKKAHRAKIRALQRQQIRKKRKHLLTMELRMIQCHKRILNCLTISKPDVAKCLETLSEMKTISFSSVCLLKNPQVVECIRKMRHYKPDEQVRQSASEMFKMFECMFGVPDKSTFSQHFRREVTKFQLCASNWVQRRSNLARTAQKIDNNSNVDITSANGPGGEMSEMIDMALLELEDKEHMLEESTLNEILTSEGIVSDQEMVDHLENELPSDETTHGVVDTVERSDVPKAHEESGVPENLPTIPTSVPNSKQSSPTEKEEYQVKGIVAMETPVTGMSEKSQQPTETKAGESIENRSDDDSTSFYIETEDNNRLAAVQGTTKEQVPEKQEEAHRNTAEEAGIVNYPCENLQRAENETAVVEAENVGCGQEHASDEECKTERSTTADSVADEAQAHEISKSPKTAETNQIDADVRSKGLNSIYISAVKSQVSENELNVKNISHENSWQTQDSPKLLEEETKPHGHDKQDAKNVKEKRVSSDECHPLPNEPMVPNGTNLLEGRGIDSLQNQETPEVDAGTNNKPPNISNRVGHWGTSRNQMVVEVEVHSIPSEDKEISDVPESIDKEIVGNKSHLSDVLEDVMMDSTPNKNTMTIEVEVHAEFSESEGLDKVVSETVRRKTNQNKTPDERGGQENRVEKDETREENRKGHDAVCIDKTFVSDRSEVPLRESQRIPERSDIPENWQSVVIKQEPPDDIGYQDTNSESKQASELHPVCQQDVEDNSKRVDTEMEGIVAAKKNVKDGKIKKRKEKKRNDMSGTVNTTNPEANMERVLDDLVKKEVSEREVLLTEREVRRQNYCNRRDAAMSLTNQTSEKATNPDRQANRKSKNGSQKIITPKVGMNSKSESAVAAIGKKETNEENKIAARNQISSSVVIIGSKESRGNTADEMRMEGPLGTEDVITIGTIKVEPLSETEELDEITYKNDQHPLTTKERTRTLKIKTEPSDRVLRSAGRCETETPRVSPREVDMLPVPQHEIVATEQQAESESLIRIVQVKAVNLSNKKTARIGMASLQTRVIKKERTTCSVKKDAITKERKRECPISEAKAMGKKTKRTSARSKTQSIKTRGIRCETSNLTAPDRDSAGQKKESKIEIKGNRTSRMKREKVERNHMNRTTNSKYLNLKSRDTFVQRIPRATRRSTQSMRQANETGTKLNEEVRRSSRKSHDNRKRSNLTKQTEGDAALHKTVLGHNVGIKTEVEENAKRPSRLIVKDRLNHGRRLSLVRKDEQTAGGVKLDRKDEESDVRARKYQGKRELRGIADEASKHERGLCERNRVQSKGSKRAGKKDRKSAIDVTKDGSKSKEPTINKVSTIELDAARETRPRRKTELHSDGPQGARSEPCSVRSTTASTRQLLHNAGNLSDGTPKEVKNVWPDGRSGGTENSFVETVDTHYVGDTVNVNDNGGQSLAFLRTRSRKKKRSLGCKVNGTRTEPNSPMCRTRQVSQVNQRETSKSLPSSPDDQMLSTFQLKSPEQGNVEKSKNLGDNVNKATEVESVVEATGEGDDKLNEGKNTRWAGRSRTLTVARSTPNSPHLTTQQVSQIKEEERGSKSLPSSPVDHVRSMFAKLSSAWNTVFHSFTK